MDETSVEALLSSARNETAAATTELGDLNSRLNDCESQLEYLNEAVDALMETTDDLIIFIGADALVEGVSDVVAELARTTADELTGKPFEQLADRLQMRELVPAVRAVIGGSVATDVEVGEWQVAVRPLEGGEPGAVVVGHRAER